MISKNLLKIGILIIIFSFCLIKPGNIVRASQDAFDYYIQGMDSLIENTAEKNEEAIDFFQKAIELDSEMSDAYLELALAYAQKYRYFDQDEKWYNLALQQLELANEIDPYAYESVAVHEVLAQLYFAKGELNKAKEECERMIELEPTYEMAHLMLGEINEKSGKTRQAVKAYKAAADLDPSLEEAKKKTEELKSGISMWFWIVLGVIFVVGLTVWLKRRKKK